MLASVGSGLVVAVPCALFHASVAPLTGSLAGFAIGVFLLSTRSDALIRPVGLRYILVVGAQRVHALASPRSQADPGSSLPPRSLFRGSAGLIAVGFVLSSIKRIQPHVLLACTCAIAAFVVVLGIDCFTCAGLKCAEVPPLSFSSFLAEPHTSRRELYVYVLGLDKLFPKLEGHYVRRPLAAAAGPLRC